MPAAGPGRRMQAVPHRYPQQFVPGGMKLDLVDAVAESIMSAQLGRVTVREPPPLSGLRGTREGAKSIQLFGFPRLEARCHQNCVSREPVHLRQGRWHVLDLVRRHGVSLPSRPVRSLPDRSRAAVRVRSAAADRRKTHRVADTSQRHAVWVRNLQASGWRSRASVDESSSVSWWTRQASPRPCWSCRPACR
jgi:hypothetical protein